MKLPGKQEGAVQSMRGVDPGVYRQAGQAAQNAWNTAGKAAEVAYDIQDQRQVSEAQIDATNKMSDFRGKYGNQDTFTAEEIQDLGWEGVELEEDQVQDDGSTARVLRQNIPAYEAYPRALEKVWKAETEAAAKKITRPATRNAFQASQQRQMARAMEHETSRAVLLERQYQGAQELAKVDESNRTGNYAGARALIRNSNLLDNNQKKEALHQSELHQEDRRYRDAANLGTSAEIESEIKYLEGDRPDDPYDGPLEKKERDGYITLLQGELNARKTKADKQDDAVLSETWRRLAVSRPEDRMETLRNMVDANGQPVLATMAGKDAKQLMDYANGHKVETDFSTWYDLDQFAQSDPEAFALLDLGKYSGALTTGDLKGLAAKQATIREGDAVTLSEGATWNNQKKLAMEVIGINTGTGKEGRAHAPQQYEFAKLVDTELAIREQAANRKLTSIERREVLDDILIDEMVVNKGRLWGTNTVDPKLSDVPVTSWNRNAEFLRTFLREPVTDTNIYRMEQAVSQLEQDGVPLTEENISQAFKLLMRNERARSE